MKYTAIVLSAGKGSRMKSDVAKQYMILENRPVITYALDAFENSVVDDVILVTGQGEEEYCRKEIVERYGYKKVSHIVAGGKERYHSVYYGLQAAKGADYVLIHDGARPFLTNDIINRVITSVNQTGASIVGVRAKDTIKVVNEKNVVVSTPERSNVWMVQTPQAFSYQLIHRAYECLMQHEDHTITDDAMVVEKMCGVPVTMVEGSYMNIKITTPEDMIIAQTFCKRKKNAEK